MKKIILMSAAVALLAAFSNKTNAQTTGNTNMHVILVDAMSIQVMDANVTLTFATPAHYASGRDTTLNGHLKVTSNQAYSVKVKAAAANLTSGANTIATNGINVKLTTGQTGLGTPATVNLSTTDGTLISAAPAAVDRLINVDYGIPSSFSATTAMLGKPSGDYTTTLTYTITQ